MTKDELKAKNVTLTLDQVNSALFLATAVGQITTALQAIQNAADDLMVHHSDRPYSQKLGVILQNLASVGAEITEDTASDLGVLDTAQN